MTEQEIIVGGELRNPKGQETSAAMKLLVLQIMLTLLHNSAANAADHQMMMIMCAPK